MRVLVADDEEDLVRAIARGLRRDGYAVDEAYDGAEALAKASAVDYDVICLDLTMPAVDGREVCRRLRDPSWSSHRPRILMLTARDSLEDRIGGLDDGADDYLVKPFAFGELTARIRALLRRDAGRRGSRLVVGDIEMDLSRHAVRRQGHEITLTPKEFTLLRYFCSRPGEVVSQEELLDHVWDEHTDPFTNTVRVTVGTLRRKLGLPGSPAPIETVVGTGYRLVAAGGSHAADASSGPEDPAYVLGDISSGASPNSAPYP
ncbi:MAG: response regulator transcription factor [Acidimicrobiia bacterium]|nr:response regulator transcription factor [Acidimicrobiia bacterium]